MVVVGLLSANGVGHRAVCACRSVLVAGLALVCRLLLLLLQQIMLPVKLLPLRVHDVEVSGKEEGVGGRTFGGEDAVN